MRNSTLKQYIALGAKTAREAKELFLIRQALLHSGSDIDFYIK